MEKRYIKIFLSIVFIGLILTALLNIFINPYGFYGRKQQEILLFNDRSAKIEYVSELSQKPEAFILGTSNSLSMPTSAVERWTGYSTFNFGVYFASAEDFYCISHAIVEVAKCKPKLIILCLDDYCLQDVPTPSDEIFKGANNRLAVCTPLSHFLPDYSRVKLLWGQLSLALSLDQTEISLPCFIHKLIHFNFEYEPNNLTDMLTAKGERAKYVFDNSGPDLMELLAKNKLDVVTEIKKSHTEALKIPTFPFGLVSSHSTHSDFSKFSERRLQLLAKTFSYLDSIHCKVIINIMPLQPYFQSLLRQCTNYDSRIKLLKDILDEDQKKYKNIILVKDNHLIENFDGIANQFYDSHHVSVVNSNLMIQSFQKLIPADALQ